MNEPESTIQQANESGVRPCCLDEENLEVVPDDRPGVTIRVCRSCGSRHFEIDAEAFQVGVEVT